MKGTYDILFYHTKTNMNNELISVIIPVHNMENYLKECIDSVIAQTYQNLEIILVDDGSTDATPQLCDAYMEQDSRIKVFHQKNQGVSAARNTGIDHATGAYIAFADPDDCCHKKQYELLYRALCDSNSDIACCSYSKFIDGDPKKKYTYQDYTQKYICNDHVLALFNRYSHPNPMGFAWNKLYKTELIGDIRFPIGRYIQDYHFNLDVFARAKRLISIDEKLYYYRQRKGSALNKGGENYKVSQDFAAACSHQLEVFRAAGNEQDLLSCINNTLKQFAKQESIAHYKKYDKSKNLFQKLFISTFNNYRPYIFQLSDWVLILIARYAFPLYQLLNVKDFLRYYIKK